MRRVRLVLALTVGLGVWAGCGDGGGGGRPAPAPTATPVPVPTQAAGSGLSSTITNAAVDGAGVLTVTFTLTDGNGVPLTATLAAAQNAQQARVRFTVAQLEEYPGGGELGTTFLRYVNKVNKERPAYDRNGMLELIDARTGRYRYTFGAPLAPVVPAATYAVGAQVDRTFDAQQLSANPVFDFVPGGGPPRVREDATTEQCNACHAPLIAHGNRREVRLCTLCHTEAAVDEKGRSVDFRHMIHKIHAGKELPSVADGPPGTTYAIYSSFAQADVVFAEKLAGGHLVGVGFPRSIEECGTCHDDGATAEFYRTKASTPACATCHDDVNPSLQATEAGPAGTNHPPGGFADGQCAACHVAQMTAEFDLSVPGAHVVPARSEKLQGLKVALTNVANAGPAQRPTVSFMVSDDAGTPLRDLGGLSSLTFTFSGPTEDYATFFSASALPANPAGMLVGPDAAGGFQFTPNTALPPDAAGTWALGAEARRTVALTASVSAVEAAPNPVVTFTVDGAMPLPRRVVVENERCAACHGEFSKDFSIHGGLRNNTEYCVFCHNPAQSDAARRRRDPEALAAGSATETIDFKVLIHKLHRGEELEQQPYTVYGFGPAPANFTKHEFGEVLFPGDLRDCAKCHVDESNLLPPFPGTALPTERTRLDPATGNEVPDVPDHLGPITAVCTACHDGDAAAAHAEINTGSGGVESCTVCHGEGRAFPVSELHAGRN